MSGRTNPAAGTPVIIIKKKTGHGGHHGGAWKVAYADFVTAMMALFIVLWLMNSSNQIKEAVGGYFKDPTGSARKLGSNALGSGENFVMTKQNMQQLKEQMQKAISQVPNFDNLKDKIDITVTSEGLRIEMLETKDGTFFDSGSTELNGSGQELLVTLARQLAQLPNKISIEGHTDSRPFTGRRDYGNWELSTDRANSARRLFQQSGLRPDQVTEVRGFGDQKPRRPDNPADPSNRRISVIVQYLVPQAPATGETAPSPSAPAGH